MPSNLVKHILVNPLLKKEDKLLVAVSGGVDSMVLTELLLQAGCQIGLAHCNYQLRDENSEKDQALVEEFSKQHQVPLHVKRVDTIALKKDQSSSIQMIARNTRYSFFEDLMDEFGYNQTVLAHNANDRVESLLMNVLRGTGLRGLQGIPSQRDRYIRPILDVWKTEIRAYAKENQVLFREDESNEKTTYQRNWVRLRLLPLLLQLEGGIDQKLLSFAQRVELELPNYEKNVANKIGIDENPPLNNLASSDTPFTLLREVLNPIGFSSDQVFEVIELLNSNSGSVVENESYRIIKNRKELLLQNKFTELEVPELQFEEVEGLSSFKVSANEILIDAGQIDRAKLNFRKWKSGDKFKPFGMNGWKKLSDFFIDSKLSIAEKDNVWILTHGQDVLWVVGMRMDNRFKVTAKTEKVLKLSVQK